MINRKTYIDFEKGILIAIVLIIHLIFINGDTLLLRILHRLCIPQFALLAGYNMNYSKNKPFAKTWLKTIGKIFFIYFWSMLVTFIVFENAVNINETITLMLSGMFHPKYNMPIWYAPYYILLWTISMLVMKLVTIVSPLIGKVLNNKNYYSFELVLIIYIILAIFGFSYNGANIYFIKQALVTLPFVFFGFILFRFDSLFDIYVRELEIKEKIVLILFVIVVLSIIVFIFIDLTNIGGIVDIAPFIIENIPNYYITCVLGGLCLFVMSKLICSIEIFNIMTSIISYIGTKSLFICCFHQIIQPIVFAFFDSAIKEYSGNVILDIAVKVILTIIVTIIVSFAFER